MRRNSALFSFIAVAALPTTVHGQDAQSILETAQQKQLERWEGVETYVIDQSIAGNSTRTYMQRTEITDDAGKTQTLFLPLSNADLANGQCTGTRNMTPEELEAFADAAEMTGAAAATEIESGMKQAGLPPGLLSVGGGTAGTSMDPRVMMGGNAAFLRGAADAQRNQAAEAERDARDAEDSLNVMAEFMATAKLVGSEAVDGRDAYHLRADNINRVQAVEDGQEYNLQAVSMWIDSDEHVPLRMKMDGVLKSGDETRPMTIDNLSSDYRTVPGSNMYEPYKRTTKISGLMDAAQEAEMREAQQQMAEFEKELASMPASQRAMMENMMGSQLETMRNMASGGGYRSEIVINSITVNPAMTVQDGKPCTMGAVQTSAPAQVATIGPPPVSNGDDLTAMVQQDLTALGYNTGGANGQMNTATIVAISKFQAENNMEVTGEVTPQLAGILSARVSGRGTPAMTAASAPQTDQVALQQAQQACLQQKMAEAEAAQKKKRGFGRLLSGVSRAATGFGGSDAAYDIARTSSDIYNANATADDFAAAAKDLGLAESDIEACRNPL